MAPDQGTRRTIEAVSRLVERRRCDPTAVEPTTEPGAGLTPYPVRDGYALSVDPFEEADELVGLFKEHGMVVVAPVLPPGTLQGAQERIRELMGDLAGKELSKGEFDPEAFPKDESGTPVAHRGFLEVFHDDSLAQLRQSPGFYAANALIWGRTDLWVTYDRLAVKSAGSAGAPALPWHVDQNPNRDPGFRTLQGLLALVDSPARAGTFSVVAGSRNHFERYLDPGAHVKEYVETPACGRYADLRQAGQAIPMRAGDLVLWDSRTTHANTTAAVPGHLRIAALLACGPAGGWKPDAGEVRARSYLSGEGWNDRDALLHASFKPRYSDSETLRRVRKEEELTELGAKLYGLAPW